MKKKLTNEQMNAMNWRYKKKTSPVDEFAELNGPVKVTKRIPDDLPPALGIALHGDRIVEHAATKIASALPHPFKCSKCTYIAKGTADLRDHWSLEH